MRKLEAILNRIERVAAEVVSLRGELDSLDVAVTEALGEAPVGSTARELRSLLATASAELRISLSTLDFAEKASIGAIGEALQAEPDADDAEGECDKCVEPAHRCEHGLCSSCCGCSGAAEALFEGDR